MTADGITGALVIITFFAMIYSIHGSPKWQLPAFFGFLALAVVTTATIASPRWMWAGVMAALLLYAAVKRADKWVARRHVAVSCPDRRQLANEEIT